MSLKTDYVPGDFIEADDLNTNTKTLTYPFFGNGTDGDVVISVDTTLTRDMYYNNLTINTGIQLKPNGYRVFVRGVLTFLGTGKISAFGGNGGDGGNGATVNGVGAGTPGTAGTRANTAGTLPASGTSGVGAQGMENSGGGFTPSNAGSGSNTTKAINTSNGKSGGATNGGGLFGIGGINTGIPVNPLKTYWDVYALLDLNDTTIARMQITSGSGGGGGGGIAGSPTYYCGGGGGGAGAPGGIIWVAAFSVVTVNGNTYADAHGGNGGNGGNGGGTGTDVATNGKIGSGGSAGNGGIIIFIYQSLTGTGTTNVLGGTKGLKGSAGQIASGADGLDGVNGTAYLLSIY